MSDVKLGETPSEFAERDAIHIAVVPMVASARLRPAQRIGVVAAGIAGPADKITGIVDPYLTEDVRKGTRFWMCLIPNTVTGMRHHWCHPEFAEKQSSAVQTSEPNESVDYLKRLAQERYLEYEEFMGMVAQFVSTGCHIVQGGRFEGMGIYDDEFWTHYENVTGKKVRDEDRGSVFSCSC